MYKWLVVLCMLAINFNVVAQKKKNNLINWVTFESLDSLLAVAPKKIMINIYTNWCGYCKAMEKEVFKNDSAANFINENYYAINFDAEQKNNILFNNTEYRARMKYENIMTHELVMQLLNGAISYPSVVILNEKKKVVGVEAGYQALFQMEGMLKYFVSESFLKEPYNDYVRKLIFSWAPNKK